MSIISSSSLDTFGMLCSPDPYASCMRFFDIRGIHIEQLGEKSLSQLIDKAYLIQPIDVFGLTAGKLTGLKMFGPRQAQRVVNAIESGRNTTLKRLIFSCGIYGVEEQMSLLLADHFKTINGLMEASLSDFQHVLPEALAVNTANFFRHPENQTAIEKLLSEIEIVCVS